MIDRERVTNYDGDVSPSVHESDIPSQESP
jgi:hypothetical protein